MNGDPCSELLEIMRIEGEKHNPPSIQIAKVVYVEETDKEVIDIKIEVDDLPVDKDNIYISDYLLKEHKREVRTDAMDDIAPKNYLSGSTSIENDGGHGASSHSHSIKDLTLHHTNIYTRDTLKKDDLVAVLAVKEKQTYIILSRVVKVGDSDE